MHSARREYPYVAAMVIVVLVTVFIMVGIVEGSSRDPGTGCYPGQYLDSKGVCVDD